MSDTRQPVGLDTAVTVARQLLAEASTVDVHDHLSVVQSHAAVVTSLRSVLAAIDAQGAR